MPRKKVETVTVVEENVKPKRTRKTKTETKKETVKKTTRARKKKEPEVPPEKKLNPGQLTKEEKLSALPKDKRPLIKFNYDESNKCYYYDDPTCNYIWVVRRMSKRGEKFIVEGLNYWYSVPKKYQLKGEQMTHQLTGKSVLVNCEAWNNTWPGPISVIMKHPRVAKSNLTEEMLSSL